jgi:hypothetical protein
VPEKRGLAGAEPGQEACQLVEFALLGFFFSAG